jgi:hypothetical protein
MMTMNQVVSVGEVILQGTLVVVATGGADAETAAWLVVVVAAWLVLMLRRID